MTIFAFATALIDVSVALIFSQSGVTETVSRTVLNCHCADNGAHRHDKSCCDVIVIEIQPAYKVELRVAYDGIRTAVHPVLSSAYVVSDVLYQVQMMVTPVEGDEVREQVEGIANLEFARRSRQAVRRPNLQNRVEQHHEPA